MELIKKYALLALIIMVSFSTAMASESPVDEEGENGDESVHATAAGEEFNPGEMILHHIADSHDWHFATVGEKGHETHLHIPLPVILYSTERGLEVFSSNKFVNEATGHPDILNGVYKEKGLSIEHGHISVIGNKDAHLLDVSITKNVASSLIGATLLIVVFFTVAARYKKGALSAPRGIQSFFEPIIIFVRDDVAKNFIGAKYATYLPYLLTLFFFIWFNNLLGLFPGGANLTGNINVTFTLAVLTFLITNLSANWHYWKHILWTPGIPLPLRIIILPIEIVGIITKPFALMVRLFANITAGHIIILSFIGLIFIFQSIAIAPLSVAFGLFMNVMELLVAILQAYIFTMLTAMYIGSAIEDHGHEPDLDHGH